MIAFKEDLAFDQLQARLEDLKTVTRLENESTTRLRAIDTVLFDVLLWDRNAIESEKFCRQVGYCDYVFHLAGSPCFVLEAKRAGLEFVLPGLHFSDGPYILGLFSQECPAALKSLTQAVGYATTLGAPYVGISNGHQWLFALTFVPDQPLKKRLVFVFESFDAICSRFRLFCACFGQSGLQRNAVRRALLDTLRQPAPPKLSSKIPGYPVPAARNVFANELSYILDYVWQVMSNEEGTKTFLDNCYVNPSSHEDILSLVRELIDRRRNDDEAMRRNEVSRVDALASELPYLVSEKPFVVLGEVGRGKTSFLKYLRHVAAKDALRNYIQIEVNFLDRPDSPAQIPDFVYREIERQLREDHSIDVAEDRFVRGVLNLDLKRFKKTPRGVSYSTDDLRYAEMELAEIERITADRHSYLGKVIHHLKRGRGCSVAMFFDNLDRREPEIQEQAFLKASALARDWATLVFICLRPSTYYRSKATGVLDAIAPRAFTVGQPNLSLVLKKRFSYAKRIAEGDAPDRDLPASPPSSNVSFDLPRVAKILGSCEFAAWKRHGIIPTLEDVSNGNIRRLLDLARGILCSGHLDTTKILGKIEGSGRYQIPDFEGVKALLFGDFMHYYPAKSPFVNLFDVKDADKTAHFLRLALLQYLSRFSTDNVSRGYVTVGEVLRYLAGLGFSWDKATDDLDFLLNKQCVKRKVDLEQSVKEHEELRITSLGRYHIFSLVPVFQYIDAMTLDTPIVDDPSRRKITDVTTLNDRLNRADSFLDYLDCCSDLLQDSDLKALWKEIASKARGNIAEVRGKSIG